MTIDFEQAYRTTFQIKINRLLRGGEKIVSLHDALKMKRASASTTTSTNREMANFGDVSDTHIREIHDIYGPSGLFDLVSLVTKNDERAFNHFFPFIEEHLAFLRASARRDIVELVCDNETLHQCALLSRFNLNVMLPEISTILYRPGTHPGFLVYGLGGPRILVSHPFQGVGKFSYDVYNNAKDVVSSLFLRGYEGAFLFLDRLKGLEIEIHGLPAWLLWFSFVAAQSDLVLFVKQYKGEFGEAQRKEINVTPDRVQKKIVEIPHEELTWANKTEKEGDCIINVNAKDGKTISQEEWQKYEQSYAMKWIDFYINTPIRKDKLIRVLGGKTATYPLNYQVYAFPDTSKREAVKVREKLRGIVDRLTHLRQWGRERGRESGRVPGVGGGPG